MVERFKAWFETLDPAGKVAVAVALGVIVFGVFRAVVLLIVR